jgi:hypothetical protein
MGSLKFAMVMFRIPGEEHVNHFDKVTIVLLASAVMIATASVITHQVLRGTWIMLSRGLLA